MRLNLIAAAFALLCTTAAHAQPVALNLGTTGIGAEIGHGFNEWLGMRGSYGMYNYGYDYTESDVRYKGKLKIGVGLLTADVHPFAGVFRLSAGLGYNNTRIDADADTTTGTIEIGNNTYQTSEVGTVRGEVHFQKTVPYVGFGWGTKAMGSSGFFFTSDFGVLFSKASGSVTGECAAGIPANICTQLQADLQTESQEFLREVEKMKYYPVVRIGLGYRF
jgi:hypothetical protein